MNPTKKLLSASLAGIFIVAPLSEEFACARAEVSELYAPVKCDLSGRRFRIRFGEPCSLLEERSFPPHEDSRESNDDFTPTTIVISVSGGNSTTSNTSAGTFSYTWPNFNTRL
jgi:hypothetical protein